MKRVILLLLVFFLLACKAGEGYSIGIGDTSDPLKKWKNPDTKGRVVLALYYEDMTRNEHDDIQAALSSISKDLQDKCTRTGKIETHSSLELPVGKVISGYDRWYFEENAGDYATLVGKARAVVEAKRKANPTLLVHLLLIYPNGKVA